MRGRKRGCPVNIRDWAIEIKDPATDEWVRIRGLQSMTRDVSGDTNDGSSDTDLWEEPYITKRSSTLKLEAEIVEDEATGSRDHGQELLDMYADLGDCMEDVTLRLTDPYGHQVVADYVVTGQSGEWDGEEASTSWDLEQVGEAEYPAYVHVEKVALMEGEKEATAITFQAGDPGRLLEVVFTPANASNQRYKVLNSRRGVARVVDRTEGGFTVLPIAPGETTIRVESINNGREATVKVRVEGT